MADDRSQMPFRLPPGQMRELETVAHSRGKTRQSFLAELVRHEIELHKQSRYDKKHPAADGQPTQVARETGGLGIAATIKGRQPVATPVTPSTTPVVVNVGSTQATTNGSASPGELDRLALYVINGDEFMRDARKRTADDILRASAATDEELKVLIARLEEIIATKTKTAKQEGGAGKIARMAFDKLFSLLGD